MQSTKTETFEQSSWLDKPLINVISASWVTVLFAAILLVTVFTRFYVLGARVMSHDETSHVYFSWLLEQGRGYQHDPITHGPFQFHVVALSYFLLGDSDFSARIPAVLFSIATVAFIWYYRRYLGRAGTLMAALLFTISPYMLYYGRYVRNEAFVALFGLVTIWAVLRYLDSRQPRYLYILSIVTVLHFTTKETAYIYTAQVLLFLGIYFVYRMIQRPWRDLGAQRRFTGSLIVAAVMLGAAVSLRALGAGGQPAVEGAELTPAPDPSPLASAVPGELFLVLVGLALLALVAAAYFLLKGFGLRRIRQEKSFDLLVLTGTLVLPLLTAFPLHFIGWNVPVSLTELNNMTTLNIIQMAIGLTLMFGIAILVGIWWNPRLWIGNFVVFYAIFAVFYTTFFTNGGGLFTGLLGGLSYWLEQQGVERGNQPWYYYLFVQLPVYEYLPALGSLLALGLAIARKRLPSLALKGEEAPEPETLKPMDDTPVQLSEFDSWSETDSEELEHEPELGAEPVERAPFLGLVGFWAITSVIAYTIAGEKMPWLTVHITLPFLLLAGWSIGYLIETTEWDRFRMPRGWLILALLPVFFTSFFAAMGSLLGPNPPFQGKELTQLQSTSTFIIAALAAVTSGYGLLYLLNDWKSSQTWRIFGLIAFAFLAVLTTRTAITSSLVNYDNANELLVYAHSGPGNKVALAQIEELSRRTTDGMEMQVAYDDITTYPFWWYLRNYSNQNYFGQNPTRSLRDTPAILVGEGNYSKIEPLIGQTHYSFEYIRMWWPNQDYYNLTWERIRDAFRNPQMREALFQIWLNRDYAEYGKLINSDGSPITLSTWEPAERLRLYLRKDLVAQIWNYGVNPMPEEAFIDPYEGKQAQLSADQVIGGQGTEPGRFNQPRSMAVAPDGSLYVADTFNHRIQHLSVEGEVQHIWGSYGAMNGMIQPPTGTFDQPWGIAVGPDGSVYVSDTWNHRIQKFTPDGQFITSWGQFGQAETAYDFWGPRGILVNEKGQVYVMDTGNDRIVIFDEDGGFLNQFGSEGFAKGQFDEPVGIAQSSDGKTYVADVWNQRIQVLLAGADSRLTALETWDVIGWIGQSVDNKPFITVNEDDHVFITDPEGLRVIEFTSKGEIVRFWGDYGAGPGEFSLPTGIAADGKGGIWVVDAGNSRLMHFTLPSE